MQIGINVSYLVISELYSDEQVVLLGALNDKEKVLKFKQNPVLKTN